MGFRSQASSPTSEVVLTDCKVFSDFQMKAAIQEESNIGSIHSPPRWLVVLILSHATTSETIRTGEELMFLTKNK